MKPSFTYRFRRLLTIPLIGLVILMLEIEFAMAGRWTRRGSNSAAAPLAGPPAPGTQRFSGAFRSRRRQLTQRPIKPPALAWGRRSAGGRRDRPIRSRPPCLPWQPGPRRARPLSTLSAHSTHSAMHRGHSNAPVTHIAYSTPATDARTVATRAMLRFISHEWRPSLRSH